MAGLTAIISYIDSTIAAKQHPSGVFWIYPESPDIAKSPAEKNSIWPVRITPGSPSVNRTGQSNPGYEDILVIIRVNIDLIKGIRSLTGQRFLSRIYLLPGLAAIITSINLSTYRHWL